MLKSISASLAILSVITISAVFFPSHAVIAAPTDNPQCDGLTGAAFGLCAAATAVGCDGSETQAPGCENIAEKFTQITGESPPWTLPPCPCGTANEMISYLDSRGGGTSCLDIPGAGIWINSPASIDDVFTTYPENAKLQCGFMNTNAQNITNDEAKSCVVNVKSTVSHYNLSCSSSP